MYAFAVFFMFLAGAGPIALGFCCLFLLTLVVVIIYVVSVGGTPGLRDLADLVRAFFGR
jgi:hypothetical protein